MTKDEVDTLVKSLECARQIATGYEDAVTKAIAVVRSYSRLESQFDSMVEIAERAMDVARLSRQ